LGSNVLATAALRIISGQPASSWIAGSLQRTHIMMRHETLVHLARLGHISVMGPSTRFMQHWQRSVL
jgi:hypothetical protein